MSAIRPFASQSLQNYPKIQIDRGSVIKPCNAEQNAADQFIGKNTSSWKKILHDAWHEGIPFLLRYLSSIKEPVNSNIYLHYVIKAIRYVALFLLYIHQVYLYIYAYFFPYSLLPLDQVCDELSKCPKWSESVIRAFAWHPNHDRCAVAICNDYIYVYEGPTRIRVLRHARQRKVTDMAWQPSRRDILVVATQQHIVIWRVSDTQNGALSYLRDGARSVAYVAPGVQLIMRTKDNTSQQNLSANGSIKQAENSLTTVRDTSTLANQSGENDFKLIEHVLSPPIISIQFDHSGSKLFACSPNSSRIAMLDIDRLFERQDLLQQKSEKELKKKAIEYMTRYGQGITRLLWSPEKNRLAAATTSSLLRVYESFTWTFNKWKLQGDLIQDMVWSKPLGRMLLIANKTEPFLYALPFLDSPQAGDVGGNKSLMKALDLTATRTESNELVGGVVQSMAWDKNGKRLAISFKENPESILLYRTDERPTIEFYQMGVIQSDSNSFPLLMEFHDKYKSGSLLTICWSDGNCQHIPMIYMPGEYTRNGFNNPNSPNRTLNNGSFNSSFNDSMAPKTPRSLTNFCHVSGLNNSISSFSTSLMPINKVQHQTTLYSLSRSPNDSTRDSNESTSDG